MSKLKFLIIKIGVVIAGLLGMFLYGYVKGRKSQQGKTTTRDNFIRHNDKHILIQNSETLKWEKIKLPKGVKYEDIKSVEMLPNKKVTVELKHTPVDRRNIKPTIDSAYDKLHGGK